MALSKAEREEFLSQPHIAALSVGAGDERGPLTVPIWYQYAPGGEPWILTGAGSAKTRLIETAGRFTLMVDRMEPTVRYVAVDGPVSSIEPGGDELLVVFLDYARSDLGSQVVIAMTPQHWLSADLGEA
jgi:hypothetical protein